MATNTYVSEAYTFNVNDITVSFAGDTLADLPANLDVGGMVVPEFIDKDGNVLSAVDSEFGFYVNDFIGAEQKVFDGDFAEGFAGNIVELNDSDEEVVVGISLRNAPTDIFLSGLPLGTWAYGLGGQTVKASTEHYATMVDVLSAQAFPNDPSAIGPLDNDLRLLDLEPTGPDGAYVPGPKHELYIAELSEALQRAIDNNEAGTNPQTYSDLDFDRDGTADEFTTMSVNIDIDTDGDGTPETVEVGAVDLDGDMVADIVDRHLNGLGGTADIVDLLEPNESTVTEEIAYGDDYSITLKDDGKLLYRFGSAVKRPNDLRMDTKLELPEEWLADEDDNGTADILEDNPTSIVVTKAELVITHDITNNPNDQVRPEDYENEAAIGRLPSYYIVQDPDDATNTLWVSPRDSFNGEGEPLPSYFKLTDTGEIDLGAGGVAVFDPDGVLVGYRNTDGEGSLIGTVLKDGNQAELNLSADLDFTSSDMAEGFTAAWYTSVDREPFEWSYDRFPDDPYKQDFISFRSPDDAALAGYAEEDLVSGPRWRLTPNKFGQDLPGLEVPLNENTPPPYQKDNIKYETGEFITTTLNLLDWDGPSPLSNALGWMVVDPGRVDENGDGFIDEGWSGVNGTLNAGDAMPDGIITEAVTPNGMTLTSEYLDTAVYVKGDRQDSAKLYDMQLEIDYVDDVIGTVQQVSALDHNAQTIAFEQGAMFSSAVVFAAPPTYNGVQAASVTVSEVTSSGATLYVDEPDYLDGRHLMEDVSMLTLAEGNWTISDGSRLEVGTLSIPGGETDSFTSVTFDQAFDEAPVVLVQLQTKNGSDWVVARTDNVSTTGFDVLLEEQENSDGFHVAEVLGWAAIDASGASGLMDWGGTTAQAFSFEDAVDSEGFEFTFDSALGLDPIISANITSYNGSDTAMLRLADLSDDGWAATAEFFVQEEQSLGMETFHKLEDLAGIAFESAGLLQGTETPAADDFMFA